MNIHNLKKTYNSNESLSFVPGELFQDDTKVTAITSYSVQIKQGLHSVILTGNEIRGVINGLHKSLSSMEGCNV